MAGVAGEHRPAARLRHVADQYARPAGVLCALADSRSSSATRSGWPQLRLRDSRITCQVVAVDRQRLARRRCSHGHRSRSPASASPRAAPCGRTVPWRRAWDRSGLASGGSGFGSTVPLSCAHAPRRGGDHQGRSGIRIRRDVIGSLYSSEGIDGIGTARTGPEQHHAAIKRICDADGVTTVPTPARLALSQMIRQRQRHAVAQRGLGQLVRSVEENAAVAAVAQFRIKLAKRLDQIGLAMEIDRVPAGFRLHLVDADGAAALALRRRDSSAAPTSALLPARRRRWWPSPYRRSAGAAPAILPSPALDRRRRRRPARHLRYQRASSWRWPQRSS